jgi:hypothetical protein
MIANQYATYYTGAIMAHLIKAGYLDDPRVERGFQWLLSMRQDDGGWTVPLLTHSLDRETQHRLTSQHADPVEPVRSKPFSHNWTDMVLRAFAAHPRYRESEEARAAGHLLKSRFFKPDVYSSYKAASYWVRFAFTALDWLIEHQEPDGLWKVTYVKGKNPVDNERNRERRLWVSLAICRILKRFHG